MSGYDGAITGRGTSIARIFQLLCPKSIRVGPFRSMLNMDLDFLSQGRRNSETTEASTIFVQLATVRSDSLLLIISRRRHGDGLRHVL